MIPLTHLNVTLNAPGLEEHKNSMLITFNETETRRTRNIFVYSEEGKVCHRQMYAMLYNGFQVFTVYIIMIIGYHGMVLCNSNCQDRTSAGNVPRTPH